MAVKQENIDKDLEIKCRRFTEGVSDGLHLLSNDPSLALYRIQEHVRKSLPQLVEKKFDVGKLQQAIQGGCFDVENAIEVVQSMKSATNTFQNIYELLRSTMYYKQQLDYERLRRTEKVKLPHSTSKDSIVQELRKTKSMGHIGSKADLMSESVASRSTLSTPCSEYPDVSHATDLDEEGLECARRRLDTLTMLNDDFDKSSTTTSGADSHVSEQEQEETFEEIEQQTDLAVKETKRLSSTSPNKNK